MKTSYYFQFKIAGHRARIAGHSDRVPAIIYITGLYIMENLNIMSIKFGS